jgi:preprotein translocase subunit SecE
MENPIPKIRKYCGETVEEIKRCSWPSRSELIQHTAMVISAVILLTVFIAATDLILGKGRDFIFEIPKLIAK